MMFLIFSLFFAQGRIVSLAPEITNILIELGLKNNIVCSAGPISGFKIVGPYFNPSLEKIIACKPDLVISSYSGTPPYIHEKLLQNKIETVLYKALKLEDITKFATYLSSRFKITPPKIINDFSKICVQKKGTAILVVGFTPLYIAGDETLISDAVKCSGYENLIKGTYKKISLENIFALKPDFIITASEHGFINKDFKLLKKHFRIIETKPEELSQASFEIIKGINFLKNYNSKLP